MVVAGFLGLIGLMDRISNTRLSYNPSCVCNSSLLLCDCVLIVLFWDVAPCWRVIWVETTFAVCGLREMGVRGDEYHTVIVVGQI